MRTPFSGQEERVTKCFCFVFLLSFAYWEGSSQCKQMTVRTPSSGQEECVVQFFFFLQFFIFM